MSGDVDTRVSPSLHPENVRAIEGYGADTSSHVAHVETAFSEMYEGLRSVHDAREAAGRNPTWNDAQRALQTDDFAQKIYGRITRNIDGVKASLDRNITAMDDQLNAPVASKVAHPVATEIRAHAKLLNTGERMSFVMKAIDAGDHLTVGAVLGGPAYLSGLEPEMVTSLSRLYHEKTSPELAKRLGVMKAARDLLVGRSVLVHDQMEKAIGMPRHKLNALRLAKNEAERAFILKDT